MGTKDAFADRIEMTGVNVRPVRRFRKAAVVVTGLLLAPPLGMGAWAVGIQFVGNVHTVAPGELYRSAQLSGRQLADVINDHHIRTVINLRGENAGQSWYDDELKVSAAAGVAHVDIRMSAREQPDAVLMAELVQALRSAQKPILVHCQQGADRSGLASAVYEYVVDGKPAAEAAGQLSFFYGHFPWLGSRTVAMDEAFARMVREGTPR